MKKSLKCYIFLGLEINKKFQTPEPLVSLELKHLWIAESPSLKSGRVFNDDCDSTCIINIQLLEIEIIDPKRENFLLTQT